MLKKPQNFIKITSFYIVINFITFILMLPNPATADSRAPVCIEEPPLVSQVNWDITPTGLLVVSYDISGNGKADFHTLRVIVRNYRSDNGINRMKQNYPNKKIFFVSYAADHHYYIAAKMPLFYGFDVDENGHWDLLYKDVSEDGVNGNERFYESPSGLFAGAPETVCYSD